MNLAQDAFKMLPFVCQDVQESWCEQEHASLFCLTERTQLNGLHGDARHTAFAFEGSDGRTIKLYNCLVLREASRFLAA